MTRRPFAAGSRSRSWRLGRLAGTGPLGRLAPVFVAVVLVASWSATIGASPARAAEDSLRLAVETTYRVDPAKGAVHVALDIHATNLQPNTATRSFFFDTLSFGIQPSARSIVATAEGRKLTVRTEDSPGLKQVRIRTPNVYYRQTHETRLTFDIPSGKPRSNSLVRVGPAHAAFVGWAWGDPGLADVRVELPRRFGADVRIGPDGAADPLRLASRAATLTYAANGIAEPNRWFAVIEASDPGALTNVRLALPGRRVAIHAWPEDKEWLDRVATVLEDGLPDLEDAIGLPWPVAEELGVTEVSSAEIEGYAGIFDSRHDSIWISEELEDHVIVHEAAHAWFNRGLYDERWINEGLADEYAARIVAGGTASQGPPGAVDPTAKAAFPLNDWPPPSRIDADTQASELYGYDASWTVIHDIAAEIGVDKLRAVFASAAGHLVPYVGAGPAETATGPADWRRFLDELEELGGSTKAEALFERWVLTAPEMRLLDDRAAARTHYAALVTAGGDWLPGLLVRKPMAAWRFGDATAAMSLAETALAERDELRSATEGLGLAFPNGLERSYESADSRDDLSSLTTRFDAWLAAAAAVRSARDQLAVRRAPLVDIGLIGAEPEAAYHAALAAFAAGDDAGAVAGSSATLTVLGGAEEIGRGRALAVGTAAITLVLLVLLLAVYLLQRRRRRQDVEVTTVAAPVPAPLEPGPLDGAGPERSEPVDEAPPV